MTLIKEVEPWALQKRQRAVLPQWQILSDSQPPESGDSRAVSTRPSPTLRRALLPDDPRLAPGPGVGSL